MEWVIKRTKPDNSGYGQDAANHPQNDLPGTIGDKESNQQEGDADYGSNHSIHNSHVHVDTS
jgi:hypothetical protein